MYCILIHTVREEIDESFKRSYCDVEKATNYCLQEIASDLFSKGLISESVKESPTYSSIIGEFKAALRLMKDYSELKRHYELFLKCLHDRGGPARAASKTLNDEWKEIQQQFTCTCKFLCFFISLALHYTRTGSATIQPKRESDHIQPAAATQQILEVEQESSRKIKSIISTLHRQFRELLAKLYKELTDKQVSAILDDLEIYGYDDYLSFEELRKCCNCKELLNTLKKYYDFLNCDILIFITEKFGSKDLHQSFHKHSKEAEEFRESHPVAELREGLNTIFEPYLYNLAKAPQAIIKLQNAWNDVVIDKLYILIKRFFPTHPALTKHIKITSSSVLITYFMTESPEKIQEIKAQTRKQITLLKYMGIFEVTIDDEYIYTGFKEIFSFESAMLDAANNGTIEAVEFLLQVGINTECIAEAITKAKNHDHKQIVTLLERYQITEITQHSSICVMTSEELLQLKEKAMSLLCPFTMDEINNTAEGSHFVNYLNTGIYEYNNSINEIMSRQKQESMIESLAKLL